MKNKQNQNRTQTRNLNLRPKDLTPATMVVQWCTEHRAMSHVTNQHRGAKGSGRHSHSRTWRRNAVYCKAAAAWPSSYGCGCACYWAPYDVTLVTAPPPSPLPLRPEATVAAAVVFVAVVAAPPMPATTMLLSSAAAGAPRRITASAASTMQAFMAEDTGAVSCPPCSKVEQIVVVWPTCCCY